MAMEVLEGPSGVASKAIGLVREALSIIRNEAEEDEQDILRYQVPPVFEGVPERPRLWIARNRLAYLLDSRFMCPQIAVVPLRTVRRRRTEYNLSTLMFYTVVRDEELDGIVQEIQHEFPTCGNCQMQGICWHGGFVSNNREYENHSDVLIH